MKKQLQKIGLMLFALSASFSAYAYDFKVDGICYDVISTTDLTCKVVRGYYSDENIVIPAKVQYKNKTLDVTSIADEAFCECKSLQSIELPNSIMSIGKDAFYKCETLQSIKIPNLVTSIGYGTFSNCTSLQSIELPNSVKSIGEYAFIGCTSLQSIELPNTVTYIGSSSFQACKSLQSVEIPNSVTYIGPLAFYFCTSLKNIKLSESLEKIYYGTFNNCSSLETIVVPGSVEQIEQYKQYQYMSREYYTFENCTNLKYIRFEYGAFPLYFGCNYNGKFQADKIGDYPEWTNTLETIYIDRRLNYSITYLNSLKEIIVGENLGGRYIDVEVKNAKNLLSITSYATTPPELPSCTNSQYMDIIVKVPQEALEAYQQAEGWKNFWNIEAIGTSGVKEIQSVTEKAEIGRYNLLGSPVSEDYDGIVIVRYSDGSTRKVLSK